MLFCYLYLDYKITNSGITTIKATQRVVKKEIRNDYSRSQIME